MRIVPQVRRFLCLAVVGVLVLSATAARAQLAVVTPAAATVWDIGTTQDITWSGAGEGNVRLELSRDGGLSYSVLFSNTPNDGAASWEVDGPGSAHARIRVTVLADPPVSTESDEFAIAGLLVEAPNGGEVWPAGSEQVIRWSGGPAGDVRIEMACNGGSFGTLFNRTPNDGEEEWTVAHEPAACRVRVTPLAVASGADESDQDFTIVEAAPPVVVQEPHGGETWEIGATQLIRWAATPGGNVRVELSRDGGVTFDVLFSNTRNDGEEAWDVVGPASPRCRIRITRLDDPTENATSGTDFTIIGLTVTAPNGDDLWVIGSQREIAWRSQGSGDVQIEVSRDGGKTFELVFDRTPNDGMEVWTVLGPPAVAILRITDLDDPQQVDDSDRQFFITATPGITVAEPNGGELWAIGSRQLIRWQGLQAGRVQIELSRDGGFGWETLFASTLDDGVQAWVVTGPPSVDARVRVTRLNPPLVADMSDAPFELTIAPLTMTAPVEGDNWVVGTQRLISWSGLGFGEVGIDLSRDGGATWETLFDKTINDGAQFWTIAGAPTTNAFIRVVGLDDLPGFDVAGPFSISKGELQLAVPNGGEQWRIGTPQLISWTSTTAGTVRIEVSRDEGVTWAPIITNTPNDGNELWTPTGPPSPWCLLRIASWVDPDLEDVSDAPFGIFCGPTALNLTPGDRGGSLTAGDCEAPHRPGSKGQLYGFTMPTTATVKIDLESSVFDAYLVLVGPGGEVVAERESLGVGTAASLELTLPGGGPYTIEVTTTDPGAVGAYRLSFARYDLELLSPTGGEVWKLGERRQITWRSGAPRAPVEITVFRAGDPAGTGEVLAVGTPNDGAEAWTVTPPAATGAVFRVCIPNGTSGTQVCALSRPLALQPCAGGESRSCYSGPAQTLGVGTCRAGAQTCAANGIFTACQGEALPAAEVCGDQLDQNCDGADLACASCPDGGGCLDGDSCTIDSCVRGQCQNTQFAPWPLYDCRRDTLRIAFGNATVSCQATGERGQKRRQRKVSRVLDAVERLVERARVAPSKRRCVTRLMRAREKAGRVDQLLASVHCGSDGVLVAERVTQLTAAILGVSSCDGLP